MQREKVTRLVKHGKNRKIYYERYFAALSSSLQIIPFSRKYIDPCNGIFIG
jgi:hypothetical protein